MRNTLFGGFIFCIGWLPLYGQLSDAENSVLAARKNSITINARNENTATVLTGREYNPRYQWAVNSQYFRGTELSKGTLVYEGVTFEDIEIQYDLHLDKVVVFLETERHSSYATLDEEKISSLSFEDYNFIHVFDNDVMPDDIYQLAFEGKNSSLFVKRRKKRFERMKEGSIIVDFTPDDLYYIKNQIGTFPVGSKKDFLLAFDNNQSAVNLIKKNKTKFSKNRIEQSLISTLTILDAQL